MESSADEPPRTDKCATDPAPAASPSTPTLSIEMLDAAVEVMGRSGRGGRLLVQGTSMVPTLIEGQQLHADFRLRNPKTGDLVLFRQMDYLVVHRCLGRCSTPAGQSAYRTRGDGRLFLDPAVPEDRVVGRVVAALYGDRWLGFVGRRARLYGLAVATHNFVWTAVGVAARRADRLFHKLHLPQVGVPVVAALDRSALRIAHFLFFRLAHAPVEPPEAPGPADSGPDPRVLD